MVYAAGLWSKQFGPAAALARVTALCSRARRSPFSCKNGYRQIKRFRNPAMDLPSFDGLRIRARSLNCARDVG